MNWMHKISHYYECYGLKDDKTLIISTLQIDNSRKCALAYHLFFSIVHNEIIPAILRTNLPGFWAGA